VIHDGMPYDLDMTSSKVKVRVKVTEVLKRRKWLISKSISYAGMQ